MAVGYGSHPLKGVSKTVFQLLALTALAVKSSVKQTGLRYPGPVKPFFA